MGKLLNLDEVLGEPRVIKWQGVDYKVNEPTMEMCMRADQTMQKGSEQDVESLMNIVGSCIPNLDIKTLPLKVLQSLFSFVMEDMLSEKNVVKPTKKK